MPGLDLSTAVRRAFERRRDLSDFECIRVLDGAGDGAPDLFIDRFGDVFLIHNFRSDLGSKVMSDLATVLGEVGAARAVYLRNHSRDARKTAAEGARLVFGEDVQERVVTEHGVRYLTRPQSQVNAGFFIEMRELRARLLAESAGHRVLNTFCFTGSLGLAAWCGGAREVVQVDISKAILGWARENLALNRESFPDAQGTMRFIEEDVPDFLARELRRSERDPERPGYDVILIDPPAFGSSKGKVFSAEKALGELARSGVRLLAPKGKIFLSINIRSIGPERLRSFVAEELSASGRSLGIEPFFPPPDFTARGEESISFRGVVISARD